MIAHDYRDDVTHQRCQKGLGWLVMVVGIEALGV